MTDNNHNSSTATIAAIATAPGRGGVGIVRISGPAAAAIGNQLLDRLPPPRQASYGNFSDLDGKALDQGIALFFQAPNSFTGEDVLELQAHGGPVILDLILQQTLKLGARLARPGEFSERAFLNDKLDLAQAEAIADLINSTSEQAARSALRSLQGAFSDEIHQLVELLTRLRVYVEAAIDFPEEEIDFLADGKVKNDLSTIQQQLQRVLTQAQQGAILQEGMNVVIAGRPNAGKSSLLNALAGKESAIVTDIAGTTRDVLREHIHINGMPLHIIDTAGLREGADRVEQIGIERAWDEIRNADRVLLMVDATSTDACHPEQIWPDFISHLPDLSKVTVIRNKVDLNTESTGIEASKPCPVIRLSAKQQLGLDELRQHLMDCMGYQATSEGGFMARRRHLEALQEARNYLDAGASQLTQFGAGELLAEDLRLAQNALAEITGEFSSDDLLGEIFSSFCIGK